MNQHDVAKIGTELNTSMSISAIKNAAARIFAQMQAETAKKFTNNVFTMLNLQGVSTKVDARLAAKAAARKK